MIKFDLRKDEKRKVRSDKKIRISPSISQDDHDKLQRLAVSCGMTKTMLSAKMIETFLHSADHVNWIQNKHNTNEQYRVTPIKHKGKITY